MSPAEAAPRILVIRRDNIGDLVCTTPLIRSLRAQLPRARIAALATRYNAPALAGNPDLDAVYAYTKAKHRAHGESVFAVYARRVRLVFELRREHFDWALLPGGPHASALWFARLVGARHTLVRGPGDAAAGAHEVEQCCNLLARMGLRYEAPSLRVVADPLEVAALGSRIAAHWGARPRRLVGLHLSARKPSQRWAGANFAEVARALHRETGASILLLWAPGQSDDRLHPGDDDKAQAVMAATTGAPVLPVATQRLEGLIAALAQCDQIVCCDGGAMHLAAALGKPIVCLFGHSDASRWRPWGVPHELLQRGTRDVADIAPGDAIAAYARLLDRLAVPAQAELPSA
jgi:ADP-heptose:LPS heptosyltransferase